MADSKEIVVLKVGDIESGKSQSGRVWNRRTLQIWTGALAGTHQVYAETPEELQTLTEGKYMAEYIERHNGSNVELVFGNLTPSKSTQPQQSKQP